MDFLFISRTTCVCVYPLCLDALCATCVRRDTAVFCHAVSVQATDCLWAGCVASIGACVCVCVVRADVCAPPGDGRLSIHPSVRPWTMSQHTIPHAFLDLTDAHTHAGKTHRAAPHGTHPVSPKILLTDSVRAHTNTHTNARTTTYSPSID